MSLAFRALSQRFVASTRLSYSLTMDTASLNRKIQLQTKALSSLESENADLSRIEETKHDLAELKRSLAEVAGVSRGGKDSAKRKDRILLKTAKGTRDYGPGEMFCRGHIEKIVKDCFSLYGGSCLDTPVFERKEILAGKYGEDAKLIFDLMDQGGEQLALRYDHTVPLARYLAMTGSSNTSHKLWQVGKVYRRDSPVMSKGRMREFSQADFDIIGGWDSMIPDSEIISILCTVLTRLEVGDFTIKMNHRKILDGIFGICGVPVEHIRAISSAVDKLDKLPWSEVRKEMTEEKGLDGAVADGIGAYVRNKGGVELLDQLDGDSKLNSDATAKQGLAEMRTLFRLLDAYGVLGKVSFDLSLARGLDYYTGLIYEAVVEASAPPALNRPEGALEVKPKPKKRSKEPADEDEVDESQVGVGSIAAGGRYDNLVSMFTAAAAGESKKPPPITPCVGVSIGLDRIFAILWPKWAEHGMRSKETMVYVLAAGDGLLEERIQLAQELRHAGITADYLAKKKPKVQAQFDFVKRDEVPFAVILGPDELKAGIVKVKEQRWQLVGGRKENVESDSKGVEVKRSELIAWLKSSSVLQDWEAGKLVASS